MAKLPDTVVIRTPFFDIAQDREVPIPGFFIISSRSKLRSFGEFTQEQALEFISLLVALRRAMKEKLKIRDAYIFHNEDSEHGFHVWVFPRYPWMRRFGKKIESVRPIMEHAKKEMRDQRTRKQINSTVLKIRRYLEELQSR